MLKIVLITISLVGVLVLADSAVKIDQLNDLAENDTESRVDEGRKTKFPFHHFLPFHALWGFGGLQAIAVLFAIKIKIIVVFFIVAFSVFYYTKFLAVRKCDDVGIFKEGAVYPAIPDHHSFAHGSGYSLDSPVEGYANHISDISSYIGYDPYSGYHDSHEHYSEHEYEYLPSDPSVSTLTYRRSLDARANGNNYIDLNMPYLGELAFQFLGVDTEGCRRRFICEFDFRARSNPLMKMTYQFVSRNFFDRYRDLSDGSSKPEKFTDCARMFNDCKAAEEYNYNEEAEQGENEDEEENNYEDDEEIDGTTENKDDDTYKSDEEKEVQSQTNDQRNTQSPHSRHIIQYTLQRNQEN